MKGFAALLMAIQLFVSCVVGQEAVSFEITDLGGRTAEYEHRFSMFLQSDRGQELNFGAEDVEVEILGSWKSVETRTQTDSGYVAVRSTIKESDSWAMESGQKLTFERYPFSFGQLVDKTFTWRIDVEKGVTDFEPDFRPWRIRNRTDIVNDIILLWSSGVFPSLPERKVSVGDSWTGEFEVERPFYQMGTRTKKFHLGVKSTYTVKKIKKKGDRRIVEVNEERKIDYSGWMKTVNFSVTIEGSGTGIGKWEIDATSGVVNKLEYQMDVSRPTLQIERAPRPVRDTDSNLKIIYDVKLKKLK